ncbi:Hypothetical predicted protein [Mytilus galloprovincialis]|uniref:Integrase catalytic domain-containing protein n=1 Tax=Mytilus galloprovincialis TaxID=29158 RepID=A0A8B6GC48_MYTGA|nr:Hypothetical predicted protein [Mytilus galloprovincialis]
MFISDALSRAYLPVSNDKLIDDELDISYIEKQLPISSRKIAEIKDATEADENLRKLSSVVVSGWPNSKEMLPDDIQYYWKFRDEITVIDGLLCKSQPFKSMFARHGVSSEVVSDNGPQFACANFKDFSHEWDFIHTTSSPRYAQSNGEAERMYKQLRICSRKPKKDKVTFTFP